uniref:Uncharacterized protein n=1 Tax=Opuntia streptacantha TaxID=393608 RepID=A0A7C9AJ03_OPUST
MVNDILYTPVKVSSLMMTAYDDINSERSKGEPMASLIYCSCEDSTCFKVDASLSDGLKYTSTTSVGSRLAFFLSFWMRFTISRATPASNNDSSGRKSRMTKTSPSPAASISFSVVLAGRLKSLRTLMSLSFRQWPVMVISPASSNAKISFCDIDLTSLATTPIDFPSLFPSTLKSGSARRDAYFRGSSQGTRDLTFNSSRTYSLSFPVISSRKSLSGCTTTISLRGVFRGLLWRSRIFRARSIIFIILETLCTMRSSPFSST